MTSLLTPAQLEHASGLLGTWVGDRAFCSITGAIAALEHADRDDGVLRGKITRRLAETILVNRGFEKWGRVYCMGESEPDAIFLNVDTLRHVEAQHPSEDRFRALVARIATWSDDELTHVDAKQTRYVAQVVLLGAAPEYPAFAPTDAMILTVVGSRERCNSYWVRNVIAGDHHIPNLTTPQIRRRLDKLEKQGKVASRRWGPGCYVEWSITDAGREAIST